MKYAAPVRKALAVPTFFNLMGPLINPSQPKHQVWGIYNLEKLRLYNYIAQKIGINYTLIHTIDGYDEISLTAPSRLSRRRRKSSSLQKNSGSGPSLRLHSVEATAWSPQQGFSWTYWRINQRKNSAMQCWPILPSQSVPPDLISLSMTA